MRICSQDGDVLELRSQRAQAILGVLAATPEFERERRFLQELLWPDRSPEQAQNSLRQEIARIRKVTGQPEILVSIGRKVRLNTNVAEFDVAAEFEQHNKMRSRAQFLEGLSLAQSFNDWLEQEREVRESGPRSSLVTAAASSNTGKAEDLKLEIVRHTKHTVAGDIFLDRVARGLSDGAPIRIVETQTPGDGIRLQHGSTDVSERSILRQQVISQSGGEVLWSSEWIGKSTDIWNEDYLREGFLTQQAILDALGGGPEERDVSKRGLRAIGDAFSHEYHRMASADDAFKDAFDATGHPAFLSWRAFLLTGRVVERHTDNPAAVADEALRLAWEAVERAPNNSAVMAAASHVMRVLSDDVELASQLAEDAIRINPTNPLGWSSAANAHIMMGQPEKARPLADRALKIARNSSYRFWWEMNACVAAVMTGDARAGLRHAETAHRLKPEFRPPLRYLVALNLAENRQVEAQTMAAKLQKLEPDFEIRLFHEPDYPTGTLRNSAVYSRLRELDIQDIEPQ